MGCFSSSLELLARDVVHGQVIHVCLDELKSLLFDHTSSLILEHATELLDQVTADALPLLARLVEGVTDDLLHVVEGLDALSHTQAEIAEPLVVQGNRPVFAEELDGVGNDVVIITRGELVQVVLVETNETPQALQYDLLVAHVGDGVDETDAVEGELDEMTFACGRVQVVTDQITSVLNLLLTRLQDQWVGRLDMVVDDVVRENTTLALGQEEEG